jgi:isoquinoline 1-oxidoreductase beta subunit
VGPTHNIFVVESFIDELAHAAKQDPVAYRQALLGHNPRALAVLALAAEKAGWGRPLPSRRGRGVSVEFAFGSYLAQVAEVEVAADGSVKVHRIVCAVDCGMVVNPDTIEAQVQGGTFFGLTAALYGAITLKNGRVEQGNFDTYRPLRIDEAPVVETHLVKSSEAPGGFGEAPTAVVAPGGDECDLRRHGQAHPHPADRHQPAQVRELTCVSRFSQGNSAQERSSAQRLCRPTTIVATAVGSADLIRDGRGL